MSSFLCGCPRFFVRFRVLVKKKLAGKKELDTNKKKQSLWIKIHFGGGHAFVSLSSLNVVGVVVDRLRTTTEWWNEYQ